MAKITVVGDVCVVTSELKLEDIKLIEKYRPEKLKLCSEDGEKVLFRIGTIDGSGGLINQKGAVFGSASHANGKAVITMKLGEIDGDIKDAIADTIGTGIIYLNKIETALGEIVSEINNERKAIKENIELR